MHLACIQVSLHLFLWVAESLAQAFLAESQANICISAVVPCKFLRLRWTFTKCAEHLLVLQAAMMLHPSAAAPSVPLLSTPSPRVQASSPFFKPDPDGEGQSGTLPCMDPPAVHGSDCSPSFVYTLIPD